MNGGMTPPIFNNTGWTKSRYRVIIFFFTGIVNDGRDLYCIIYTVYLLLVHVV